MNLIIESLFKHTPLANVANLFKTKKLFVIIPKVIIFFSFIIYGIAVWTALFIIAYENGLSFYVILETAAGQWSEFIFSYTPRWIIHGSSWPSIISQFLWTIFVGFSTMLVLLWGAIILIRGAAYLFGFLGHIFLFLKKLILDQ